MDARSRPSGPLVHCTLESDRLTSFDTLRLAAPLLRALTDEGYTTPTPIQIAAIPPALQGRDVLGCAQTGTGKTAAFALPILQALMERQPTAAPKGRARAPRALILSPTRELAAQIGESFAAYGRHTPLRHAVVFGGVSQFHQVKAIERGVDVLVATPGRLIDLLDQGLVSLGAVEHFVLDEADRMLDMGFIEPIRRIAGAVPARRRTMLFSATMPDTIAKLAASLLRDPVRVATAPVSSTATAIDQTVHHVSKADKLGLLQHLLDAHKVERALVFTRTKHGADRLGKRLARAGIAADSIHGDKAQNQRLRALDRFRTGRSVVLVATDVAARGLDVDGVTHVFNYDLPVEPEAYVHRIGRTGRAGASGEAIAFCDPAERDLLRQIERLIGRAIRVEPVPAIARTGAGELDDRLETEAEEPAPLAHEARPQHGQRHSRSQRQPHSDGSGHRGNGRPSATRARSAGTGDARADRHGGPTRAGGGAGGSGPRRAMKAKPAGAHPHHAPASSAAPAREPARSGGGFNRWSRPTKGRGGRRG